MYIVCLFRFIQYSSQCRDVTHDATVYTKVPLDNAIWTDG